MYPRLLDLAATGAFVVFCAFMVSAGGVLAWHDRRGPAHRLPLLALVGAMGLIVLLSAWSFLFVRPYHVGSAWWAQGLAYVVVLVAGAILWHGFGTCLKGLVPRRVDGLGGDLQASALGHEDESANHLTLRA